MADISEVVQSLENHINEQTNPTYLNGVMTGLIKRKDLLQDQKNYLSLKIQERLAYINEIHYDIGD